MDDVRAVMDAAGSERAVLWTGLNSTGIGVPVRGDLSRPMRRPHRSSTRSVRGTRSDDYPWAPTEEEWREQLPRVRAGWGERAYLEGLAREWAPGSRRRRRLQRLVRLAHAPQHEPRCGADGVSDRDGARRLRRPRRRPRPDAHPAATRRPGRATTRRSGSGAPSSWSCRLRGPVHVGRRRRPRGDDGARPRASSPVSPGAPDRARSRHAPLHRHRRLDRAGSAARRRRVAELLERHHAIVRRELARFQGRSSTPPAMGSSPRSTGRPGRSRPRRHPRHAAGVRASRSAPASTPASASHDGKFTGSPSRLAPGSRARRTGRGARLEHGEGPRRRLGDGLRGPWNPRAQGCAGCMAPLRGGRDRRLSAYSSPSAGNMTVRSR